MNRRELTKRLGPVTTMLLEEKGYIAPIDVFVKLGYLSDADVESWRMKKVPYLEKRIGVNLNKISFILGTMAKNCRRGGLKPSRTVYKSWGKGPKRKLQFSKSGLPQLEDTYSTHYIKPSSGP